MSLESELARWAKSAAGKAKLKEARKNVMKRGGRDGVSGDGPEFYAEEFIRILSAEMALAGFEYGDYLYWADVGYNEVADQYEIHVNFKPEEVDRPSLYPGGYPDGIGHIAALMNTGYSAKDYVYGTMADGRRGRSRKERHGSWFVQRAIAKLQELYGVTIVVEFDDAFGPG